MSFTPIDLSPYANFQIQGQGNSSSEFPTGNLTLGGVPFTIPATSLNGWRAASATGPNPIVLQVPVGVFGVTEVNTLINTDWGTTTPGLASIEFDGSGGAKYTYNLVGGSDIRDYNNLVFTNTINGTSTTNVFTTQDGQNRLDMQTFSLPPEFATQTLSDVQFIDNGQFRVQRLIVSGLTVGTDNSTAAAASVTTFAASAQTIAVGQSDTFAITVAPATGTGPTPTGSVTIFEDGNNKGNFPLNANGQFITNFTALNRAAHTVYTAIYSGDTNYAPSTSNAVTQVYLPASTATGRTIRPVVPTLAIGGQKFVTHVPLILTNTGPTLSGNFSEILYLAASVANSPAGLTANPVELVSLLKHAVLKKGRSLAANFATRLLPASVLAGTYNLVAQITDPLGNVDLIPLSQTIVVANPLIALSATVGAVRPAIITARRAGSVIVTVTNTGNINAIGPLVITLSPSSDGVSALPGITLVTARVHLNLRPGKTGRYALHFKSPTALAAGTYFPFAALSFNGVSATAVGALPFTAG